MQQMVFDDRPYIVVAYIKSMEAWSNKWDDVIEGPSGWFSDLSAEPQVSIRLSSSS
jgi:hypothetical protein